MKGILTKMAPEWALPSAVSRGKGEGGPVSSERGGSLLSALVDCLFWNAFSYAFFEPPHVILEALGFNLCSLWSAFSEL